MPDESDITATKAVIMTALRLGMDVWLYWDQGTGFYISIGKHESNDIPITAFVANYIMAAPSQLAILSKIQHEPGMCRPFLYANQLKISLMARAHYERWQAADLHRRALQSTK